MEVTTEQKSATEQEQLRTLAERVAAEIMEKAKGHREGITSLFAGGGGGEAAPPEPRRSPVTGKHMTEGTGINLIRLIKAKAVARMDGRPVVDVLKSSGGTVLLAAGTYLAISSLGYIVLVYFITYATRQLGLTLPITLTLVMTAAAVCAPSLMLAAR